MRNILKEIESSRINSSRVERFADAMTHGLGLFLSVIAFSLLIFQAAFSAHTHSLYTTV